MKYESSIQLSITRYLNKLIENNVPLWFTKVTSAPMARGTRGIPDLLVCYKGLFLAFEVKTTICKVSGLQQMQIDKINRAGGFACVVKNKEDVKKILMLIDETDLAFSYEDETNTVENRIELMYEVIKEKLENE